MDTIPVFSLWQISFRMAMIMDKELLYGAIMFDKPVEPPRADIRAVLHPDVYEPYIALRNKAAREGIDLQIASGQRDFARQLSIWNRKVNGDLPVLDDEGHPLDLRTLSSQQQVMAILRWSSLPGASRHHWGTDIDVFDAAVIPPDYKVQLTTEEACRVFGKLHRWLDQQIAVGDACDFFRPYATDRGGVAPEPWHLSYAPLARRFQREFSVTELANRIASSDIALRDEVLASLDPIYKRFIEVPAEVYPGPLRDNIA